MSLSTDYLESKVFSSLRLIRRFAGKCLSSKFNDQGRVENTVTNELDLKRSSSLAA